MDISRLVLFKEMKRRRPRAKALLPTAISKLKYSLALRDYFPNRAQPYAGGSEGGFYEFR